MKDYKLSERSGTAVVVVRNLWRHRASVPPDAVLLEVGVRRGAEDDFEWNSTFLTPRGARILAAKLVKAAAEAEVKP